MDERKFGPGFRSVFAQGQTTLGINFPIESYPNSPIPSMQNQIALARQAEAGGFAALWSRDVPLVDPSFGDAGQIHDPWPWIGFVAASTSTIALATGSIILPLRQPVDLAKSAATLDQLSQGRMIFGVASGDRPVEYSVYNVPFDSRDQAFRDTFSFIRSATHRPANWDNQNAARSGQVELLPKSLAGDLPLIVTGNSRQSIDWIATQADGWLMYPRPVAHQRLVIGQWHDALEQADAGWKPFSQSLYIDLTEEPDRAAQPIHLGYQLGRNTLITHLDELRTAGVNHINFNVRFSRRPVDEILDELCEYVIPEFPRLDPERVA